MPEHDRNHKECPEISCLSVSEAREMLVKQYGTPLEDNDPVFMAVTLHEAFMKDLMRMLEQHAEALGHVMEHEVGVMQDALETGIGEFTVKVRELSMDNVLTMAREQQKIAVEHYQAIRQLTYVNMVLAGVTAALAGVILWIWRMG